MRRIFGITTKGICKEEEVARTPSKQPQARVEESIKDNIEGF